MKEPVWLDRAAGELTESDYALWLKENSRKP
jgi:hypothetical protein